MFKKYVIWGVLGRSPHPAFFEKLAGRVHLELHILLSEAAVLQKSAHFSSRFRRELFCPLEVRERGFWANIYAQLLRRPNCFGGNGRGEIMWCEVFSRPSPPFVAVAFWKILRAFVKCHVGQKRCGADASLQERMQYLYSFRPVEMLNLSRLSVCHMHTWQQGDSRIPQAIF